MSGSEIVSLRFGNGGNLGTPPALDKTWWDQERSNGDSSLGGGQWLRILHGVPFFAPRRRDRSQWLAAISFSRMASVQGLGMTGVGVVGAP